MQCSIGHRGVEVNKRSTRWIIGGAAAALWGTTLATATIELHMRWYLALWLATGVASAAVLICLGDSLAAARQVEREARSKAAFDEGLRIITAAIREHGEKVCKSVFSAQHWAAIVFRAGKLAEYDAAAAKEAQSGDETGPFRAISRLY
jgi:hypothetical protein